MTKFRMMCVASFCFLSPSANATTAVLCGDPALVDENNNSASVWLILLNSDSRSVDEIEATFLGKEARVVATSARNGQIFIQTAKPSRTVVVSEADIDSSVCDGETLFSVQMDSTTTQESIGSCRCFED